MSHDAVLDWKITKPQPGQSSVDFLLFKLENLLTHLNAYDPTLSWSAQDERCVLILDNARVHDQAAIALPEARGVLLRFLPPFSPELNPIEDFFSVGSSWLRRHVEPEQFNAWPLYTLALMLASITPAMSRGFVRAAVRPYSLYTWRTSKKLLSSASGWSRQ